MYSAHVHAFAFLLLIALTLSRWTIVDIALAIWIVIYVGRARKKVYEGAWWTGFLRSLPVGIVYITLLALGMTALVAITIAFG